MRRDWLPAGEDVASALSSIKAMDGPTQRWAALRRLAGQDHDLASLMRLDRAFRREIDQSADESTGLQTIRLAVLANSTTSHLAPALRIAGLARGLRVDIYEPAYAQGRQEMADSASGLHRFQPNAVLFATDPYSPFPAAQSLLAEADDAVGSAIEELRSQWRFARETWNALVIQQIPVNPHPRLAGENEMKLPGSPATRFSLFQRGLRQAAAHDAADVVDLDHWSTRKGLAAWHAPALWHRSKQDVHPAAAPFYGDLVTRLIAARYGKTAKCLVLDLDNTLWGGVIGDDGLSGIILGQGSALGESFIAFQAYARQLAARGIILAVCSKNDDAVARDAFAHHPEMVLRLDSIGCFVANWDDKATNLRAIARSLNIGTDALVFADDNPFERSLIRRELPEVMVPELGEEPADYAQLIADSGFLESVEVTQADLMRTGQYQAKAKAAIEMSAATDLGSYLTSLAMTLSHSPFDPAGIQRVVQLINKTNQFNLRTQRYSQPEAEALLESSDHLTLQFRLTDRLADNGIIGVIIGKIDHEQSSLMIETWLMSCRVLGRQVERAALNILADAAHARGARTLIGEYIPSDRNAMVADHYEKLGFSLVQHGDAASRWSLDITEFRRLETPIHEECAS